MATLVVSGKWEDHFRAMGTDCHVVVEGAPKELLARARNRIDELERRWSRFIPDSELSQLNTRGSAHRVSEDSFRLIACSLVALRLSDGRCNAFMGGQIRTAGYDRDFAELQRPDAAGHPDRVGAPASAAPPVPAPRRPVVHLDRRTGSVRLAEGALIDSGGIGKGLGADLVSSELIAQGARACLVNLGGDLRVRGWRDRPWEIGIDDASGAMAEPVSVRLSAGGLATSSVMKRRWRRADGQVAHHLIDPRTGRWLQTDQAAATAIAPTGWLAEVLAKCAMLMPRAHLRTLVHRHFAGVILQSAAGDLTQVT